MAGDLIHLVEIVSRKSIHDQDDNVPSVMIRQTKARYRANVKFFNKRENSAAADSENAQVVRACHIHDAMEEDTVWMGAHRIAPLAGSDRLQQCELGCILIVAKGFESGGVRDVGELPGL
jgi:hypothetical protein